MKLSMFLAPQFSMTTVSRLVFAYLAIVTVVLVMAANPFQGTASLDLSAHRVAASTHTVVVEIPSVQIPAAPYVIVD